MPFHDGKEVLLRPRLRPLAGALVNLAKEKNSLRVSKVYSD